MSQYGYKFQCMACQQDVVQQTDIELVIVPINGASECLQCCAKCAAELKRELAELEKPKVAPAEINLIVPPSLPDPVFTPMHIPQPQETPPPLKKLEDKIDGLIDAMVKLVQTLTAGK